MMDVVFYHIKLHRWMFSGSMTFVQLPAWTLASRKTERSRHRQRDIPLQKASAETPRRLGKNFCDFVLFRFSVISQANAQWVTKRLYPLGFTGLNMHADCGERGSLRVEWLPLLSLQEMKISTDEQLQKLAEEPSILGGNGEIV